MKNSSIKLIFRSLATIVLVLLAQTAVFASGSATSETNSGLNNGQVVLGFTVLVALLIAPAFKKNRKLTNKSKGYSTF